MEKLIRHYLLLCFTPLVLTACHIDEGQFVADRINIETRIQESIGLVEDIPAGKEQENGQNSMPEEEDTKVNTSEKEKAADNYTQWKELDFPETDYVLPDSDSRLYSWSELETLPPEHLKIARNEIYARHGRRFKDNALQTYFQGKSWYQGTAEPDEFDHSQLNQTECDNLSLLLRLEQDAKGKAQKSSEENEKDISDLINADYVDILSKNQYRPLYLSTEEGFDDNERIRSQVIDHGLYYEVTHGRILADTCYNPSMMNGKVVGDTLQLGMAVYRITEIDTWCLENGENIYLEYISGSDMANYAGYFILSRNYGDNYYTLLRENAETQKDILYTGSLYFSKDCMTTVNAPDNGFKGHTVDISDYLTENCESVGAQYGLSSGKLVLWGNFKVDSSGQIISYTEIFLP